MITKMKKNTSANIGKHERRQCPAYNITCHECGNKNHYVKMCNTKI